MRNPLSVRRWIDGKPCMLLAVLFLAARLVAPAMAMPSAADAIDAAALRTICHAGPAPDGAGHPDQVPSPDNSGCQLCPACHLAGQLALLTPGNAFLESPTHALVGLVALLPPSTGPPGRPRLAAQPTGPPLLSV